MSEPIPQGGDILPEPAPVMIADLPSTEKGAAAVDIVGTRLREYAVDIDEPTSRRTLDLTDLASSLP